ncbi:unnamed protein product [Clonostachys rosea]|uniref:BTB domain-containing protein n=1 Tax=Bionectria ochroleuca TaxID=29856 RepID=A0ABY6U6R5_BIOOC|nr:unnamed protein product [Clonostachys rosea]
MKRSLLELDPSGDTILVLKCPNMQSGGEQEEPSLKKSKKKKKKRSQWIAQTTVPINANEPEPAIEPEIAAEPETAGGLFRPEPAAANESAGQSELTARPECKMPVVIAPEPEPETRVEQGADIVTDICALREFTPWDVYGEPTEVRLRVSSAHLCLASPVFRKTIRGSFKESIIRRDGFYEIRASEWDIEAFLVVLDTIHGHNRHVPKKISLELLVKVSTIVDYYDCHESVDRYIDIWIPQLESDLPKSYDEKVPIWLSISWVFRLTIIFEKMVKLAVMQLQDLMVMRGLPLTQAIIGT